MTALKAAGLPVTDSCDLLGVPRSSYYRLSRGYRHYRPVTTPIPHAARVQPAALSAAEQNLIITLVNDPDRTDLSVQQIYWRAFDQGRVACSQSTFYRVANAADLTGDRRRTRRGGPGRTRPQAAASCPNHLWSWDATELRGPGRERYQLTLIIDVYSRYPIGWRIDHHESKAAALALFTDAIACHGAPNTVHSDNGAVMRSHELINHLHELDIVTSCSRPRVSNDNPFSESMFKTIKYQLDHPETFDGIDHARTWTHDFLHRYATEHRHSGLAHHTPESVYTGAHHQTRAHRQQHLDTYWTQHPERFRTPPTAPAIHPTGINLSQTG